MNRLAWSTHRIVNTPPHGGRPGTPGSSSNGNSMLLHVSCVWVLVRGGVQVPADPAATLFSGAARTHSAAHTHAQDGTCRAPPCAHATPQDAHAPGSIPSPPPSARPTAMALPSIKPQQAAVAPDRWGDTEYARDTDPSKYVSGSVAVAQGKGQSARWADARDQDPPAAARSQQQQQPASSSFVGFPQQQDATAGGGGSARPAYQAASGPAPPPPDAHAQAGAQAPQTQAPPGRGTRSGPYTGFASGKWMEVEMRGEVDDLAHRVDQVR
jgi:hypothetical protein